LSPRAAESDSEVRRRSLDAVAAEYAKHRLGYPAAVFDAIAARVPPPASVLEIGPGPGLAILPMAERGYAVLGVELGANLACVARERLERYPSMRILNADFEGRFGGVAPRLYLTHLHLAQRIG
jgi:SAM-dependent methyltransferase